MSERRKLEEEFLYKHSQRLTMADFIIAYGKLVENCKHEKTRWIQELTLEGNFSKGLVKRCHVCGVNIDSLDVEREFVEKLLDDFDAACEKKKLSVCSGEEQSKKETTK